MTIDLIKEGMLKGAVEATEQSRKLTIDGITKSYQVYRVRLDYLYYNDQNDRIATWISEYKAEKGENSLSVAEREVYNGIIQEFIIKSNPDAIKKTQANIEAVDQREPGVVLLDGRIIDGNRRFTCLRNLSAINDRFKYFETVILDKNLENNAKQIKMLELMIQHGEESKIDYNPIDRLVGIYNDIIENKLLTEEEYRKSTNENLADIKKKVGQAKLLVEFLEFINAPLKFYIARDMDLNGPLVELQGILKKVSDHDRRESLKNSAFSNFLMQPDGDMTRFIRKVKTVAGSEHLDEFLDEQNELAERVLTQLPPIGHVTSKTINEQVRSNTSVKQEMARSLEKAELKAKSTETRNKPLEQIERAVDSLTSIDTNIIRKLNHDEISKISVQLDELEQQIMELREIVNV